MSLFGSSDIHLPPPHKAVPRARRGDTDAAHPMPPRRKAPEEKKQQQMPPPQPAQLSPSLLRKGEGEPAQGPGPSFKTLRIVRYIAAAPYGASIDVPLDWLDPYHPKVKEYQTAFFSEMSKIASIHLRYRPGYFQFQWKTPYMAEPATADMADFAGNAALWTEYCKYLREDGTAVIFI